MLEDLIGHAFVVDVVDEMIAECRGVSEYYLDETFMVCIGHSKEDVGYDPDLLLTC